MAVLYISEFGGGLGSTPGNLPVAPLPPLAEQTEAIGGASSQSNTFNAQTRLVRLNTDVACSVAFGSNPTATTASLRLPADHTEYFAVNGGDRLAVIANT